jgi:hypothetical protein
MNFHGDNLRPAENTYTIGPDSKNIRRMQQEVFDMISFDELKSRARDLTQSGVAKAKELTDVAKLNMQNSLRRKTSARPILIWASLLRRAGHGPRGGVTRRCVRELRSSRRSRRTAPRSARSRRPTMSPTMCGLGAAALRTEWAQEPAAPVRTPSRMSPAERKNARPLKRTGRLVMYRRGRRKTFQTAHQFFSGTATGRPGSG